ncbi:MAG TPA: hypothetical protein VKR42_06415 [Ktedonobacteraceae bacterium]|nr:hypothetical protein [Ktedonobacteraceae bacterium]
MLVESGAINLAPTALRRWSLQDYKKVSDYGILVAVLLVVSFGRRLALSNFHTGGSGSNGDSFGQSGASPNGANEAPGNNGSNGNNSTNGSNSFVSRRDIRASNPTGALPVVGAGRGYASYTAQSSHFGQSGHAGSFDFEAMLVSLHDLFDHDRQIASLQEARRCGICYLHFMVSELHYREEEGLYVCESCDKAAGKQHLPMLRRQQK